MNAGSTMSLLGDFIFPSYFSKEIRTECRRKKVRMQRGWIFEVEEALKNINFGEFLAVFKKPAISRPSELLLSMAISHCLERLASGAGWA